MNLDTYIEENKNNINIKEIADKFNLSVPTVYRHLRMMGVKPKKNHSDKRLNDINKLRSEGKTYQEIGNIYGISRQRVEQIINRHN
jgi:DNA-binding CsgD family transcriptional regulator